jgi:DUF4097 and DUF4098 domain-containing protein YvlB
MPTFDTPEPISVTIDLSVGDARIAASDRADTVVQVRPSDSSRELDVRLAEQTRVEYAAGALLVKTPKQRGLGRLGKYGSVDVTIELPAGSHVQADAAVAGFSCTGRLGDVQVKTATGDIQLDQTGPLDLRCGAGAIAVHKVTGSAEVSTGSGRVRLQEIGGAAVIKTTNGDTWVGEVTGDLRVNAANGDITIDRADADVTATTANGDVRVASVSRGATTLKTGMGQVEVGISPGTAARLDVFTHFGRVQNRMDGVDSPEPTDQVVEISARTSFGDIVIRQA